MARTTRIHRPSRTSALRIGSLPLMLTAFFAIGVVAGTTVFLLSKNPTFVDDSAARGALLRKGFSGTESLRGIEETSTVSFSERWEPFDCDGLIHEVYQEEGSIKDPNEGQLYGRLTDKEFTRNPFWISVHNSAFDFRRFSVFEKGNYYEKQLTTIFQDILEQSSPNSRVVDVGGNIGWFTLLSSSMGHHVDVFEPNAVNLLRLCQSLRLNGWEKASEADILSRRTKKSTINVRKYGVSDAVKSLPLFYGNPGQGTFINTREFVPKNGAQKLNKVDDLPLINLDTMAEELNWYEMKSKIAILKIDIEGSEADAIKGGTKLLKSGLVENILMETSGRKNNTENQLMLEQIIKSGFVLKGVGTWSGPGNTPPDDMPTFDPAAQAKFLIDRFTPTNQKQMNLHWKWNGPTVGSLAALK